MFDLLKAAARFGARTGDEALTPDILRFTLEYGAAPDLNDARARLAGLLEGDGFDLFPLSADDPALLILQFPRVRRQQSPDFLFAAADELVEPLGLISATPEIDAAFAEIETRDPQTESLRGVVQTFCQSHAAPGPDPDWAIKLIRADAARARFGVTGAGVRIGQPDTGVAEHAELAAGIDEANGFDVLTGAPAPRDPLAPSMGSPGHGTGVASVAIGRGARVITGAAPGATLTPVRCVDSVVIGGGAAVAKAIDHARAKGCHIVSLSLGGPFPDAALRRAIDRAVTAGMIVVAAAGNCVRMVVYPARLAGVIAVSGVNANGEKWIGACAGGAVDVSAPAENVHVARRIAVPPGHEPGPEEIAKISDDAQGTSFAAALTAGVAALWLERFGPDACRAAARRRGVPVQELFRAALRATARAPEGWDAANMGAGVIDAEALCALPLGDIPAVGPAPEQTPALGGSVADIARHWAEAAFLAFDRSLRGDPDRAADLESPIAPEPSPRLARLLDQPEAGDLPAPASIVAPATPPEDLSDALRRLGATRRRGLESAESITAEAAVSRIREEGPANILTGLEAGLRTLRAQSGLADATLQDEALRRFEHALTSVAAAGVDGLSSNREHRHALEAMVRLTGRPALRITEDPAEIADNPNLGVWGQVLLPNRPKWLPVVEAVGRIDVKDFRGRWVHGGTGFLLPGNRVMTNRHVLDVFADPMPSAPGEQAFRIRRRASIIFDPDAKDETTRFEIVRVLSAGKERIGRVVDLGKLDMAILEVEPDNGEEDLPDPIDLTLSTTAPGGGVQNVLVIGYPAKPTFRQAPGDADKAEQFWRRVSELYGDEFGVKYASPGMLMRRAGAIGGDAKRWAFSHDATTFPGNSGSAIIALDGQMNLCGLHFGGSTLTVNYAHDLVEVREGGDGVFDTANLLE